MLIKIPLSTLILDHWQVSPDVPTRYVYCVCVSCGENLNPMPHIQDSTFRDKIYTQMKITFVFTFLIYYYIEIAVIGLK